MFVLNMQLHRIFSGTGVSENTNGTIIVDPGQGSANPKVGASACYFGHFLRKQHAIEKKNRSEKGRAFLAPHPGSANEKIFDVLQ